MKSRSVVAFTSPHRSLARRLAQSCLSLTLMALGGCGDTASEPSADATGGQASTSGDGDVLDDNTGGITASGSGSSASSGGEGHDANHDGGTTAAGGEGGSSGGAQNSGGSSGGAAPDDVVTWPLINGVQWADTDGKPIQAHGGGMLKVGEDYYWFGENRNPDSTFLAVSAYRSADLRRWEHVRDVLTMNSDPDLKPANVERPKVVYNATTNKYVMWMHWENGQDYGEARAAVASSDTVDGDYTYHGSFRPMQDSGVSDHGKPGYMSRDCTLFVDEDGSGYFLSASNENYDLHLYKLSSDYLEVQSRAALLFEGGHREAPALFKRQGTYFLLTSGATGWDPNQAQYATSSSLTSGWSSMKNVADGNTFYSQSTYVQAIGTGESTEYFYMGDRWAGAWGGRVNDSSYIWQPISFSGQNTMSMSWANTLQFDAVLSSVEGAVHAFTFVNKKSSLVLAVAGDPSQNSSDVVLGAATGTQEQAWRLNYDGAGHFRLANDSGGKIIDVPDESSSAGVALILYDDHSGDNQVWRIIDLGQGDYRVQNKNSGLYMGTREGATQAGTIIEQQTLSEGDEQIWSIQVAP